MELREIADAIEQSKASHFAEVIKDVEAAKSEAKKIAADSTRSTDWIREQTEAAVERFNADLKAKADAEAAKLEKLYQNGLDADRELVKTFGRASRVGSGSDMAFSSDSLREAMRAKYVANDFTSALRAISEFE